jgi:hypothetical protein
MCEEWCTDLLITVGKYTWFSSINGLMSSFAQNSSDMGYLSPSTDLLNNMVEFGIKEAI